MASNNPFVDVCSAIGTQTLRRGMLRKRKGVKTTSSETCFFLVCWWYVLVLFGVRSQTIITEHHAGIFEPWNGRLSLRKNNTHT